MRSSVSRGQWNLRLSFRVIERGYVAAPQYQLEQPRLRRGSVRPFRTRGQGPLLP